MTFLLDVNVLIALIDPAHAAHDAGHVWFEKLTGDAWAICPLTENGVIRILGNPKYPGALGSLAEVADIVARHRTLSGYVFWPDDISLVGAEHVARDRLFAAGQVTDTYLLALAVAHQGRLATFDRRLSADAVKGGKAALHLIAS